jgi:hypothetical protein
MATAAFIKASKKLSAEGLIANECGHGPLVT